MPEILLPIQPRRSELYLANFEGKGSVQQGVRPALIVQNDFINETAVKTTVVCPLTSRLRHLSTHVFLEPSSRNGLETDSEVIAEQVVVINKSQLIHKIGEASEGDMKRVEDALLLVFDISDVYRRDEI